MIIGIPLAIAAWYGLSPGASAVFEAVMVTTWESVLAEAKPIPGKCFIEGTLPPAARPVAKALERDAVVDALKDHVRPCWYMNEAVDEGTSATGARSALIPAHRSTNAVDLPWAATVALLSLEPMCGTELVGGAQGTRLTVPPSWSVAMSSGGCPPASAAWLSCAASVRRAFAVVMFAPNRMTPPTSPRPILPRRLA